MNELSLFTGAGGGVLGTKLLNWRTVGYVEWEPYCQKIIEQRIKDGFLDEAPIFGDIDHFIESGAAKKYAGFVDVVTAGFPCQPFSVAGKKRGQDDERNKWPETLAVIRDLRPGLRYALLENVPGLLNSGYFGEILSSLAEAGFDARWCVLGADDVGAPHRRKRLWILAYPMREGSSSKRNETREQGGFRQRSQDVADSESIRMERSRAAWEQESSVPARQELPRRDGTGGRGTYWKTEPRVGRVVDGLAYRMDRLKALGNGQTPQCLVAAWLLLTDQK